MPCVYRKRNSFCTVLADTVRAIRVRVTACVHCMRVRFSGPGSLFVTMNGMGVTQVRIKRVYEKPGPDDGFRVLVDRLWPRGIRKEDLSYDLWAKEIAPSPGLRSWFHRNEAERWGEFSRRYRLELEGSDSAGPFLEEIGKHVVRIEECCGESRADPEGFYRGERKMIGCRVASGQSCRAEPTVL